MCQEHGDEWSSVVSNRAESPEYRPGFSAARALADSCFTVTRGSTAGKQGGFSLDVRDGHARSETSECVRASRRGAGAGSRAPSPRALGTHCTAARGMAAPVGESMRCILGLIGPRVENDRRSHSRGGRGWSSARRPSSRSIPATWVARRHAIWRSQDNLRGYCCAADPSSREISCAARLSTGLAGPGNKEGLRRGCLRCL